MNSTAATVESGVGGKPAWTSAAYNGGTVTAAGINAGQAEPGSTQPVPGRTDSLRFAPTIAYELTKLEGVAAAQVVLAGESAYAAVRLKPGIGAEAKTLAPAIARHMLELSPPQIKYAYVTDNAEFAERLAFYSKEERRTGSWRKYKEEFESAVNLLFAGRKG